MGPATLGCVVVSWRDILSKVVGTALDRVLGCESSCGVLLIASADAVYAPLAPVDTGSGELKMLASKLAGILAHSYAYNALPRGIDAVRAALEEAENVMKEGRDVEQEARSILQKAGISIEPSPALEPRHAVLNSLRYYIEAYEEAMAPRRRRRTRPPSQQDAVRHVRRLLREIGRFDPFLAKSINTVLRSKSIPV